MGQNISVPAPVAKHRKALISLGAVLLVRNHFPGVVLYALWRLTTSPLYRLLRSIGGRPIPQTYWNGVVTGVMRYAIGRLPLWEVRLMFDLLSVLSAIIDRPRVTPIDNPRCRGVWFGDSELNSDCSVILYFHGGGHCMGNARQYPGAHQAIVDAVRFSGTPVRLLSLEYSLAPEHPYPVALGEAVAAYEYLMEVHHISPSRIIFAGDSAGGGMAITAAAQLRETRRPLPAGLLLISPWVDLTCSDASFIRNAKYDLLHKKGIGRLAHAYVPTKRGDPSRLTGIASPAHLDLIGMPPMLILRGELECFTDSIQTFAERARRSGVTVTEVVGAAMMHIYPLLEAVGVKGSACREAHRSISSFIISRLPPPASLSSSPPSAAAATRP